MSDNKNLSRRTLIKGAAGAGLLAGVGMPAISRAQSDVIKIGHLTPITGFLGPLGEYAQMGVKLAAEEINAGGGVLGRKIDLVLEDSVNPQTASAKAERDLLAQRKPDEGQEMVLAHGGLRVRP
jgi:branched-chain amino acid transport system substrate-binding protein